MLTSRRWSRDVAPSIDLASLRTDNKTSLLKTDRFQRATIALAEIFIFFDMVTSMRQNLFKHVWKRTKYAEIIAVWIKCIALWCTDQRKSFMPLSRRRGMPQFNITDKVIIIFVRTTVINRRCRTHKEIIVASLKKGKAKWSSFYIVYTVTDWSW